ncbi:MULTISPECIES: PDZ domain-containing protein [unclassified Sporolactobacillus]|uniref:PDZ domain-containing protein n=1 Tax=unclassified Sporolactobacillus TaxID=2628533 RepID=UPI0023678FD2|nr:PDZ domain-containing protein [Sporolactobacillus sp. CQH2019]MDD9148083.1 PDZ domain-containing protein [Sporolactobacillus sp. CQH2019]
MGDVIRSILLGIASFFYNPVFYLLVLGLFLFSIQRVKRERLSFHIKAYGMFNTVFASVAPSLIMGAFGSALLLLSGTALPAGVIVLLSCAYLLIMLTTQLRFLSPAIAGGAAMIVAYWLPNIRTPYPLVNGWIDDIRGVDFFSFGIFLVTGLLIECLLVYGWGARQTSPRLIDSRRGSKVGAHEASALWIVPLFFLVPSAGPVGSIGLWPFVSGSGHSFGFALFPLGVGIAQLITHTLPKRAVRTTGHWLLVNFFVTGLFVGLSYLFHLPLLAVIGGALALIGRLALIGYHHYLREKRPFYFIRPTKGIRVVGVIPNSLGDRMGIRLGEEILRVNDQDVVGEYDFYEALQQRAAYCKLEVIDRFGEPRFAKGPIHQDDGHRIGLLFLEAEEWLDNRKTKA